MSTRSSLFPLLLLALVQSAPAGLQAAPSGGHVALIVAEDEYKTWETLPAFGNTVLAPAGFKVSAFVEPPGQSTGFPTLVRTLPEVDVILLSMRRRALPADQLQAIRAHLEAGKALVGIRTACHAFALRRKPTDPPLAADRAEWTTFDPDVLGGNYTGHHGAGPKTTVAPSPGAANHPILQGVDLPALVGHGSLYRVSPLAADTTPLLTGSNPDKPVEPILWTRFYGPRKARIVYTSLGHPDDFQDPQFRRLLLNAVQWAVAGK